MTTIIRNLYVTRVAFAIVWVSLLVTVDPSHGSTGVFGTALLIAYPATDAIASAIDLRREPTRAVRALQATNLLTSATATLLVAVLAPQGITEAMNAFAGWAIVAGSIQLSVGLLRMRKVDGQWPMIISGAGSLFAGTTFLDWTASQAAALHALEQYSIGGAIWYGVTACWLTLAATRVRPVEIEQ